jgi:ClpP class serine protease
MEEFWAIQESALKAMETGLENGNFAPEQIRAFEARFDRGSRNEGLFTARGRSAIIQVTGVLTKRPNFFAFLFGGGNATYAAIQEAILAAEADSEIEDIELEIESPGGTVAGMFETARVISEISKPVRARIEDLCASAAFLLATQADEIVAVNDATLVGSLGILVSAFLSKSRIEISSTKAPDKAPDLETPQGVEVVRARLDALHEKLAMMVSTGRTRATKRLFTTHIVNRDFGKGGVLTADAAKQRGMIDGVSFSVNDQAPRTITGITTDEDIRGQAKIEKAEPKRKQEQEVKMDIGKLKAEHPNLFGAVIAEGKALGFEEGVLKERARIKAHLKMGTAADHMKFAMDCIESGKAVSDDDVFAEYQTAAMNRTDSQTRESENAEEVNTPPAKSTAEAEEAEASALLDSVMSKSRKSSFAEGGQVPNG